MRDDRNDWWTDPLGLILWLAVVVALSVLGPTIERLGG